MRFTLEFNLKPNIKLSSLTSGFMMCFHTQVYTLNIEDLCQIISNSITIFQFVPCYLAICIFD